MASSTKKSFAKASSSSLGSNASSGSTRTQRTNFSANDKVSQQISNEDIENAYKFVYIFKSHQEITEIDKHKQSLNELKKRFCSARDVFADLSKKQSQFNDDSMVMKEYLFAKEIQNIVRTFDRLVSKHGEKFNSAKIHISDEGFAKIRDLFLEFKNLLRSYPNSEEALKLLEIISGLDLENKQPKMRLNKNMMAFPKQLSSECDQKRERLNESIKRISYLKIVQKKIEKKL